MSVLILAADQKQAVPVVQSLGKRHIAVACLSPKPTAPAFVSRYCSERILFAETSDRGKYAEFLKSLVKQKKFELLIACSDYSTVLISEHRDAIFPYAKALLPEHDLVKMVTSKAALMKFAAAHGIPAPKTWFPENSSDVEASAPRMTYPMVVKGDVTAGALKVRFARSESDLVRTYNELRRIDDAPILQEYIDGKEFVFYGLCNRGTVIAFILIEVIRSYPPTGGNPAKAFSIYDAALKTMAFDIVAKTRWTGIMGLNIKRDRRSGIYHLLDFNPRFGATTFLAVKCGVDLPYLLYQLAVTGKERYVHDYSLKTYRSLFREDLFYAVKRPLSLPRWLAEFLDPRVYYGYDKDDPRPFYRMATNALRELKRAVLR